MMFFGTNNSRFRSRTLQKSTFFARKGRFMDLQITYIAVERLKKNVFFACPQHMFFGPRNPRFRPKTSQKDYARFSVLPANAAFTCYQIPRCCPGFVNFRFYAHSLYTSSYPLSVRNFCAANKCAQLYNFVGRYCPSGTTICAHGGIYFFLFAYWDTIWLHIAVCFGWGCCFVQMPNCIPEGKKKSLEQTPI